MTSFNQQLPDIIRCPTCHTSKINFVLDAVLCSQCNIEYPIINNIPILIDDNKSIFKKSLYQRSDSRSDLKMSLKGSLIIPSLSLNFAFTRLMKRLRDDIKDHESPKVLVVGSGMQRQIISNLINLNNNVIIFCLDIDVAANVDFIADAHNIPIQNETFDAVITTAVLEHVLDPRIVSDEIWRVLKVGGLVYSEIPFMQQVHEGAYDFTRYTFSGHRRLFNRFGQIDAGVVAGPGTSLAWSFEYFLMSFIFFRRSLTRRVFKLIFRILVFWIKYFDYFLIRNISSVDAASCTYFYGYKINDAIEDVEIINSYIGSRSFRHY